MRLYSLRKGGRSRMVGVYLLLKSRRKGKLEDFVERELDRFLRMHRLEIISYEVVRDAGP